MVIQALTTFVRLLDRGGSPQGRYHNGRVGTAITLDDRKHLYLPFIYSGPTRNRTGDNLEAGLTLASNVLALNMATDAVEGRWTVEVTTCSMHPETWEVGRVMGREVWIAAAISYDPVQVEVVLSSGIDAVGASAPNRVLTSALVGSLPFSGAIQNL
jgi:hypothetical protein